MFLIHDVNSGIGARRNWRSAMFCIAVVSTSAFLTPGWLMADSVNSPNITLSVDTNRSAGPGAGNISIAVNTITVAETTLAEYSSGAGKKITLTARPGFQFDPTSNVTAQSATFGINGAAANTATVLTPAGIANEVLTFNLTSGGSATVQDIIRINGIKLKILSAAGAAGPAQTTLSLTTSTAGGAFTNQGIVAATIAKGTADHLAFSIQPGTNQAGAALLPAVTVLDFGGNIVTGDPRTITLAIQRNPGLATLQGITQHDTVNGVATWASGDDLRITVAGVGYTLRASHSGAAFSSSDTADSTALDITAGLPGQLAITRQPVDTVAGGDILIDVTAEDEFGNPVTTNGIPVTLDSAVNPGGWPLLVDSGLTKPTVNGVASWTAADHLRINKQITGYRLSVSGLGTPLVTNAFNITSAAPNHLVITQQPVNGAAGQDIAIAVTVDDAFGNVATAGSVDVTLSLDTNPAGATLLASSSLTKATANGLVTWSAADDLHINIAGTGYRITASGAGSTVTSDTFDVAPAGPSALRFVQQPTDTDVDTAIDPAVTVQIIDAFGNPTAAALAVTLSLPNSSCGGNISGDQATSVSGLATFANVQLDTPCDREALVASSPGLTSAFSDRFNVLGPPPTRGVAVITCGAGVVGAMTMALVGLSLLRWKNGTQKRQ